MKKIILFIVLLIVTHIAKAQDKFIGSWYLKDTADYNDYLKVNKNTSEFLVMINQLSLKCKNKYHSDTLYLYVMKRDCGRLFFPGSDVNLPKINSLFAKCYIKDKMLHIIYTQKIFIDNVNKFKLITVMYRR